MTEPRKCRLCGVNPTPTPYSHSCSSCLSARVKELRVKREWTLGTKIQYSKGLLRKVAEEQEHLAVSVSGGKSSTVLAHLALATWPRERLSFWFGDTRLELPETYAFLRQLDAEWNLGLHWIRTPHNPWRVFALHGWPVGGKRRSNWPKNGRIKLNLGSECCRLLKHGPLDEARGRMGITTSALGIQASESVQRRIHIAEFGDYYLAKKRKVWNVMPLAHWTDEDVWAYHEVMRIPHSEVYDMGYRRNGCWACGMDVVFQDSGLWTLEKVHPRFFAVLMKKGMGEVINAYRQAMERERPTSKGAKIKRLPDRHGCFQPEAGDQVPMFEEDKS